MVEKHPGKKFYDQYGLDWVDQKHKDLERLRSVFKAEIFCRFLTNNKIKPQSILDFGCGQGNLLALIGKKIKAKKLYGVDLSETMLKIARNEHSQIIFRQGDEKVFDADSKIYDLILFSDVLEHLENPEKVLENAYDKARYVLISLPLHRPLLEFNKNRKPRGYYTDGHLQEFSRDDVLNRLKETGWHVLDAERRYPPSDIVFHPYTLSVVAQGKTFLAKLKYFALKHILMRIPYWFIGRLLALKNGQDYYLLCEKNEKNIH